MRCIFLVCFVLIPLCSGYPKKLRTGRTKVADNANENEEVATDAAAADNTATAVVKESIAESTGTNENKIDSAMAPSFKIDIETQEEGQQIIGDVIKHLKSLNQWLQGVVGFWDDVVEKSGVLPQENRAMPEIALEEESKDIEAKEEGSTMTDETVAEESEDEKEVKEEEGKGEEEVKDDGKEDEEVKEEEANVEEEGKGEEVKEEEVKEEAIEEEVKEEGIEEEAKEEGIEEEAKEEGIEEEVKEEEVKEEEVKEEGKEEEEVEVEPEAMRVMEEEYFAPEMPPVFNSDEIRAKAKSIRYKQKQAF